MARFKVNNGPVKFNFDRTFTKRGVRTIPLRGRYRGSKLTEEDIERIRKEMNIVPHKKK